MNVFEMFNKLFFKERPFTSIDASRMYVSTMKAAGCTAYAFVDVGVWDGKGGAAGARAHGAAARRIIDAQCPGDGLDPDLSNWKTGRLAILLPKTTNAEILKGINYNE